jgi:hypothetical protein
MLLVKVFLNDSTARAIIQGLSESRPFASEKLAHESPKTFLIEKFGFFDTRDDVLETYGSLSFGSRSYTALAEHSWGTRDHYR